MDPKAMPQLTKESKENELVAIKGGDLQSNETDDPPGNDIFSKDNNLLSIFLTADTTDLSLASLSLDSDFVLAEVKNYNCTLQPHLDCNASKSPSTDVKLFDIQNTVREVIGFKPEKELVGECDIISGFMIHSFTTLDALEQFVTSSAYEKTVNLSSRLKKTGKLVPSSSREMNRMDASLFVLSSEPYCEDYSVPCPPNKRRLIVQCKKRFCTMGCICDSLSSTRPFYEHCNHAECMFNLVCFYKQNLRYRDSSSTTERNDSREFRKFSENDLLKQLSSIKEEIYLKTDLIDRLVSKLNEKQLEINNLKKQLMGKSIFRSNINLRPSALKSDTSTIVNKVKAGEDKKIRKKMKEKPKTEFKEETESRRVKAKVKVKNAKVKASHAHVDGLNMNSFPFDENILNELAKNTTYSIFVRQLMRQMFTFDFLASKTCSWMEDEHMTAITDATMKRFKFYHRKNGESIRVTPELVKKVIVSEFNLKQTQKKLKRI